MRNKDFANAFTKAFYYANNMKHCTYTFLAKNFPLDLVTDTTLCLPSFFDAFEKDENAMSIVRLWLNSLDDFMNFFSKIDGKTRVKLLFWINEHYKMDDGYGLDKTLLNK